MQVFHQGKFAKKALNIGIASLCLSLSACSSDDDAQVNTAPVFDAAPLSNTLIEVDESYSGSLMASDEDGDSLVFSKQSGPDWFSVAADGSITSTHQDGDIGDYQAVVVVSDGENSSAVSLSLTVNPEPDKAPTDIGIDKVNAIATLGYRATLTAVDENQNDSHTFTIVDGPDWLAVSTTDLGDVLLEGEPPESDEGEIIVALQVSDGTMSFEKSITLTIAPKPVAEAPEFSGDIIMAHGGKIAIGEEVVDLYTGTLSTEAVDGNTEPLALTYEKLDGPTWLTIDELTGDYSGQFTIELDENNDPIPNAFTVRVTNSSGKFDEATLKITSATFQSPSIADISVNSYWDYNGQLLADDGHDGSSLTYSFVEDNDLFEISATGVVTRKRDLVDDDYKTHSLAITVTDGVASSETTVDINVASINAINIIDDFSISDSDYMGWVNVNTTSALNGDSQDLQWFANRALKVQDDDGNYIDFGLLTRYGATMQKYFSTLGQTDLNLSYGVKKYNLDGEEFLAGSNYYEVEWSLDGITWTLIERGAGEHNQFEDLNFDLPVEASNQPIVAIRFITYGSERKNNLRLDNILISGTDL